MDHGVNFGTPGKMNDSLIDGKLGNSQAISRKLRKRKPPMASQPDTVPAPTKQLRRPVLKPSCTFERNMFLSWTLDTIGCKEYSTRSTDSHEVEEETQAQMGKSESQESQDEEGLGSIRFEPQIELAEFNHQLSVTMVKRLGKKPWKSP